jgi:hypothetical protein
MQPQVQPSTMGLPNPPEDMRDIPRVIVETRDEVNQRNAAKTAGEHGKEPAERNLNCLLPPLTLMSSPTVAVAQCQEQQRRGTNTSEQEFLSTPVDSHRCDQGQ